MTFVTYAQNFEDVMLWRALKHIDRGFYIDIGAYSPDFDSVTRAFYERNWRGINVEPNPFFYQQLNQKRPRDINLKVALGDTESTLIMNFIGDTGLSTAIESFAKEYKKKGFNSYQQKVEQTLLSIICEKFIPDGQEIHFLKVDVEGMEREVLQGNNWKNYQPWIVLVEAMSPMTQNETHASWEPILLEAGYQFVYADGLNRFYLSNHHLELIPFFKYPPNIFDQFSGDSNTANQYFAEVQSTFASRTWKITKPLRWISSKLRKARFALIGK